MNPPPSLYDRIYGRDNPEGEAHGWIQWKNTDVCMDIHCACGHHGHFDGGFFYHFECPSCHRKFAVGQNVAMIELTESEVEKLLAEKRTFQTCELDDEDE